MEDLKDLLKFLLGFAGVVACIWVYLRLNLFLYERDFLGRYSTGEPQRVEIQTLFQGNTKDDRDQI
jgi:hypothetical protein